MKSGQSYSHMPHFSRKAHLAFFRSPKELLWSWPFKDSERRFPQHQTYPIFSYIFAHARFASPQTNPPLLWLHNYVYHPESRPLFSKVKVKKATSISTFSVSFITKLFALFFSGPPLLLLSHRSLSSDLHQQVFLTPSQIHLKCLHISCWQPALRSVCFLLSAED